uniref:Uncharacterized protein n=1 Tax=Arundo donax TaxID=35708 RepID=A0A0A9G1V6_ARUDO
MFIATSSSQPATSHPQPDSHLISANSSPLCKRSYQTTPTKYRINKSFIARDLYKNGSRIIIRQSTMPRRAAVMTRGVLEAAAAELVLPVCSNCSESTASGMFSWSGLHRGAAPPLLEPRDSVGCAV